MAGERIKIVVWDSIGNTLLGVRPWSCWTRKPSPTCFAKTRPAPNAPRASVSSSPAATSTSSGSTAPTGPYAPFGQLYADYEGSVRFTLNDRRHRRRTSRRRLPGAAQGATARRRPPHRPQTETRPTSRPGLPRRADGRGPRARRPGRGDAAGQLHHRRRTRLGLRPQLSQAAPRPSRHMRARNYAETWGPTRTLGPPATSPSASSEWARSPARSPATPRRSRCPRIYWDIERFPEIGGGVRHPLRRVGRNLRQRPTSSPSNWRSTTRPPASSAPARSV